MKRLVLAGAAACPFLATLGGCYWLASYEDLTSGVGAAESGAEAEGAAFDAPSSDVAALDSTTPTADAGDSEAATGPFCPRDAGPLAYCMDFDHVDASALGLGTYRASAAVVTGTSVSPPSALFVSLEGYASSGAYGVSFPFQPRTSRLEFDIQAMALGQWVTGPSITLVQDSTKTARTLNVVIAPDGHFDVQEYFSLPDGGNASGGKPTTALDGSTEAGTWHHVILTLTANDSAHQYLSSLTVDGQVLEQEQPLTLGWAQGNANLGIGVNYGGGAGPQFYFDNVRADFGL